MSVRKWLEFFIESGIRVLGFSSIGIVALIFLFLLREGLPVLVEVPAGNLFGVGWYPTFDQFGIVPLLLGSLLVTIVAILIALPLGVATAVYVREVAPNWAREFLKPLIEVLGRHPICSAGVLWHDADSAACARNARRAHRAYSVHGCTHPRLHGVAHHYQCCRRRA